MRSVFVFLFFVLVLSLALPVSAAHTDIRLTVSASDPTFNRVLSNCSGLSGVGTNVYYVTRTVDVTVSGDYTAHDIGIGDGDPTTPDGYIIFYPQGGFDPANSLNNCVDAVDDTGTLTLAAGRYTMVITTFSNGATGPVIYSIDGPGDINILSDTCTYPLPSSGTGVLSIPNGAAAYWGPDLQDGANFSIPAGTWHITNVSGDFAQVWISCQAQPVWVLKSAIVGDLSGIGATTVDLTTIGLARSSGACPYILPSNAAVESLPDSAPAYFGPDLKDGTNFNVPAGHWWVVYTYGDFSQLWISCQADPVWVLTKDLAH